MKTIIKDHFAEMDLESTWWNFQQRDGILSSTSSGLARLAFILQRMCVSQKSLLVEDRTPSVGVSGAYLLR